MPPPLPATTTGRIEALQRAADIHLERGDRAAAVATTAAVARVALDARRPHFVDDLADETVGRYADQVGTPGFAALEAQLARAYFFLDDNRKAIEVIDRVLEAAERDDLRSILADALVTRGSALCSMGRLREGLGVLATGERMARDEGLTRTLLRAINNTAVNSWHEDPARAAGAAREGLALAQRVGDKGTMVLLSGGAAYSAMQGMDVGAGRHPGGADHPDGPGPR